MIVSLCRLLVLLAVALMPTGMASATPLPTHVTGAGHCDDEPDEFSANDNDDCILACSAVPATGVSIPYPILFPRSPHADVPVADLGRIDLEIATPPPKLS